MPASIFISYRRSDVAGHAGRLHDRLRLWFDTEQLFYDLDSIDSGDLFPERIELAVQAAQVVVVLIGPDWVAEINRRTTVPELDFVRIEVELALRRQALDASLKVIPILLGGARPVVAADLHQSLHPGLGRLPSLQSHEFQGRNRDWDQQFVALRELLAKVPGVPVPRFRPPAGEAKPFRLIPHLLSPHFRDPTSALTRVREQLHEGQKAAIVVPAALYGMGGVGKTQLALKYSHEYRDSYAGVWWLRAESASTLELDAGEACVRTGAAIAQGELPTTAFARWLEQQQQPWLLVLDNVEYDQENKHVALPLSLLQLRHHHVLITSRYPAWDGIAGRIDLKSWSESEGADFLAARLPHAHGEDLRRLSRVLGGLQLALEQAAAFLDENGGAVADYCTQIEAVDSSALLLDEGRASTRYERTVFATLSLAFDRLTPPAQQLLRLCAFFSAEPIPERYFREGTEHLPAELAVATQSMLPWERTAGELRRFGIAERSDIPSLERLAGTVDERVEKALVLHRLTLEVARHALSVAAEDGPRAQRLLWAQCPSETEDPTQWPRHAALLPHLMQLERLRSQAWLDRRLHSWMLDRAASYLRLGKALYRESGHLLRAAIELVQEDLGEEHPDTLTSMGNLGTTLHAQGNLSAARELQQQVLAIQRRVLGEEHPHTLTSMGNLASTLWAQGDLPAARELEQQVLVIRRRVLGQEHSDTLASMNNLATTLRAEGDLPAARELQQQVLAIQRRVLGEEHPATLTSMNNLASTLWDQGDLLAAHELEHQVLTIRRRVLGEEHPDTLTSMNNLGLTLWHQDRHDEAIALVQAVVAGCISTLGPTHPTTVQSTANLQHMRSVRQRDH